MTKILFTAMVYKAHIRPFHLPYIAWCMGKGWEVEIAAKNDFGGNIEADAPCSTFYDIPFCRSPFSLGNIRACRELKRIIDESEYDIIHCNMPVAAILTRIAARDARNRGTQVIYTAHGFHFYEGAPLVNWLLYYPLEKWFSRYTDVLITINQEDYERALHMHAKKVIYVPGVGVDTTRCAYGDREKLREELGLCSNDILLLSVGELRTNKNHAVVLRAMKQCANHDIHYAIAGDGPNDHALCKLVEQYNLSSRVHFLGYREDIPDVYAAADIFCFPSYREGLPCALLEAMSSGLPCIVSDVRGNRDLIESDRNGFLFSPYDEKMLAALIQRLIADPLLCSRMGEANRVKARAYDRSITIPLVAAAYEACVRHVEEVKENAKT